MGYIEELRSIVGNRPLILTASAVIVRDPAGRVLLQHRADTHNWGIPGGFLEPGESVEEAARRELFEETGLNVKSMSLYKIFSGKPFYFTYPNGDKVHNIIICFLSSDVEGSLRGDHESLDLRYFDLKDLPQEIIPTSRLMLESLLS